MTYRSRSNDNADQESPEQRKASMKAMRAEMALSMSSMKVFGFSEDKSEEQGLVMPGSANIAFAWDSADVMDIEYKVPLSFFGSASSFDQREISIGCKVYAAQYSGHHSGPDESSTAEGRHGGGGYDGGSRKGGGGYGGHWGTNTQQGAESMTKDQSFWTKYTFK